MELSQYLISDDTLRIKFLKEYFVDEISNSIVVQDMYLSEIDKFKHATLCTTDLLHQYRHSKRYAHAYFNRTATTQNVLYIGWWG